MVSAAAAADDGGWREPWHVCCWPWLGWCCAGSARAPPPLPWCAWRPPALPAQLPAARVPPIWRRQCVRTQTRWPLPPARLAHPAAWRAAQLGSTRVHPPGAHLEGGLPSGGHQCARRDRQGQQLALLLQCLRQCGGQGQRRWRRRCCCWVRQLQLRRRLRAGLHWCWPAGRHRADWRRGASGRQPAGALQPAGAAGSHTHRPAAPAQGWLVAVPQTARSWHRHRCWPSRTAPQAQGPCPPLPARSPLLGAAWKLLHPPHQNPRTSG
mmetsp:Transcript_25815/g.70005  ORF Transcript_25815/g.70005 Transcript_25815/m.70005 type:complete len:267 (+) Transcript_25815:1020-1820(+)